MTNYIGDGADNIFTGGSDDDTARGNDGNDQLSGNGGNDTLSGDAGNDILNGGDGDDILHGHFYVPFDRGQVLPPPVMDTGNASDILNGGAGDDRIFGGYGDIIDGGPHSGYWGDTLLISFLGAPAGITVNFNLASQTVGAGSIAGIEGVEWVEGSNFADDITMNGNSVIGNSVVYGLGGNDRLVAGYYTTGLYGGDGDDVLDGRASQYLREIDGGAGNDTIYTPFGLPSLVSGGSGDDILHVRGGSARGGEGNDTFHFTLGNFTEQQFGESGNDTMNGHQGRDVLFGGSGADQLFGNDGDDYLYAADGDLYADINLMQDSGTERDELYGGNGNDFLVAGYGDVIDGGGGTDQLWLSLAGAGAGIEFDTALIATAGSMALGGGTISGIEQLLGLWGTAGADRINVATQDVGISVRTGEGNDVVISNSSSVTMLGGGGDDRLISGAAGDSFNGEDGIDTVDYRAYASGVTVTLGLTAGSTGSGAGGDALINVENVEGSAFADTLNGSNDTNLLLGLGGDDTLRGFGGDDVLIGGAGADTMSGGVGNDTFYVEDLGDQVIEAVGEGNDRVFASVSYVLGAGQSIETLSTANAAGTAPISLTGNDLGQLILGNAGANVLSGGGGGDILIGLGGDDTLIGYADAPSSLQGGTGDDTYRISNTGDSVIEFAGEGSDRIYASVSYTLSAGQEVEFISAADAAGTAAIDLTGNAFGQAIVGNAGANILVGGGGGDYLIGLGGDDILVGNADAASALQGGTGDDWYYVSRTGDSLVEFAGEGDDRIVTTVSYTLSAGQEIETLAAADQAGIAAIDLAGNELGQAILGNAGANLLVGGGGSDYLIGLGGDDILVGNADADSALQGGTGDDWYYISRTGDSLVEFVGEGNDRIVTTVSYTLSAGQEIETLAAADQAGTAAIDLAGNEFGQTILGNQGANILSGGGGADILIGLGGADILIGGDGEDQLYGGAGSDVLNGGAGADLFVFADAPGAGNVDLVQEFVSGVDRIFLENDLFAGLAAGALAEGAFRIGSAAQDADDRILYDPATGALYFDADGNGAGAAIQFAVLSGAPALAASDFTVI